MPNNGRTKEWNLLTEPGTTPARCANGYFPGYLSALLHLTHREIRTFGDDEITIVQRCCMELDQDFIVRDLRERSLWVELQALEALTVEAAHGPCFGGLWDGHCKRL